MRRRADSLIFVVNQILDAVVEVGNLAGRLLLCLKAKVIIDGRFGAQIRVALDVGVARMRPVHVELAGRRGAVGTAKVGLEARIFAEVVRRADFGRDFAAKDIIIIPTYGRNQQPVALRRIFILQIEGCVTHARIAGQARGIVIFPAVFAAKGQKVLVVG